ncbi:hypothetical protein ACC848_25135 [Rhizobium johnstonii]|uniref:hypothetical protein n=1 Tax=Rhizobium johnstonii TaxID=3019933 RepID=UPI003F9E8038
MSRLSVDPHQRRAQGEFNLLANRVDIETRKQSNILVVKGDKALAQAYAVHILDVYDHYRFRAVEAELKRQGKMGWSGFLATEDGRLDA